MLVKCERTPPVGWPGNPCQSTAMFDVLYRLRAEREPRGIRLCLRHFEELKELKMRRMEDGRSLIADWDAKRIR